MPVSAFSSAGNQNGWGPRVRARWGWRFSLRVCQCVCVDGDGERWRSAPRFIASCFEVEKIKIRPGYRRGEAKAQRSRAQWRRSERPGRRRLEEDIWGWRNTRQDFAQRIRSSPATNTSARQQLLRLGSSYAYSGQLIASRKEHKCGICPQKCCLSCAGEMGMPGREEEKDQYSFFFLSSPLHFFAWGRENVGDETPCKCGADYDCLALRYARSTSQSNTFI